MASLDIEKNDMNFVFSKVNESIDKGLDEDCPFEEVLTIDTKSDLNNSLKEKILKYCVTATKSNDIEVNFEKLSEYKIYWPYSENWDKKSKPRSEEFFHGEGVNGDGISYKLSSKRHNW